MAKLQNIYALMEQTLDTFRQKSDEKNTSWHQFLHTAAWNYTLPFHTQALIFAQRPSAKACSPFDFWVDQKGMNRHIRAGAKGIAVLDDSTPQPSLQYLFDFQDTTARRGAPDTPIWHITPDKQSVLQEALLAQFQSDEPSEQANETNIRVLIQKAVAAQVHTQWPELLREILATRSEGSFEGMTDSEAEAYLQDLLIRSISTCCLLRCELEPGPDTGPLDASRLSGSALTILGNTTQTLSCGILQTIAQAIRSWDRTQKEEQKDEHHILTDGRVPDSQSDPSRFKTSESIRSDPLEISEAGTPQSLHPSPDDRPAPAPSSADRGEDPDTDSSQNGAIASDPPGTGAVDQRAGVGSLHGPASPGSGGRTASLPLVPISEEDIQFALRQGSRLEESKYRIYQAAQNGPDALSVCLEKEYGHAREDGISLHYPDGKRGFLEPQADGIRFNKAKSDSKYLSWSEVGNFILRDIQEDHYLSKQESSHYETWQSEQAAQAARLNLGAQINVLFAAHPLAPGHTRNLRLLLQRQEYVRAYIYENSETAKESLARHLELLANGYPHPKTAALATELLAQLNTLSSRQASPSAYDAGLSPDLPTDAEQNATQTLLTGDLTAGDLIDLPGGQYRILSITAQEATLQIADNPAFSQEIPLSVLSTLLKNAHSSRQGNKLYTDELGSGKSVDIIDTVKANGLSEKEPHFRVAAAGIIKPTVPLNAGDILLAKEASSGFLKANTPDIRAYFQEHSDPSERIAYLQTQVYSMDTFYEFGPEGKSGEIRDRKGFVARDEGVTLWTGGSYIDNAFRETYDWLTVAGLVDASLQKDLETGRDMTLFDFVAPTPHSNESNTPTPEPTSEPSNYALPRTSAPLGGPKARFQHNVAAIQLLKQLEDEDRSATHAEQEVLDRYVGWGGLSKAFDSKDPGWAKEYALLKELLTPEEYESARESTLTSFFTPPEVTHAIFKGLSKLGFRRGNILDPCCGTGKFLGSLPDGMSECKLFGVEKDSLSGRIAKKLYPSADIQIQGYEDASFQDNSFDVAVGNVPFGDYRLYDPRYNKQNLLIHDYFLAKTLDKVRPGGILAFVTSQGTLDKKNSRFREYLSQRADLLGAMRLPNDTFHGNAGTDVTTDILFLQKRERPAVERADWIDLERKLQRDPNTGVPLMDRETGEYRWSPEINTYFAQNPEMILGTLEEVSGPHGLETACLPRPGHDLKEELTQALDHLEGTIQARQADAHDLPMQTRRSLPADPSVRNFSYTIVDDVLYFREDSEMVEVQANRTAMKRIRAMVELRDIVYRLINAQLKNAAASEVSALQKDLNVLYDDFVATFGRINSRGNELAFSDDSAYYLLCSLENIDDKSGDFISKADIFHKRTIAARTPVTHTETAKEALMVSMRERGRIDFGYMTQLCGQEEDQLKEALKGEIFPDPEEGGAYVLAATYLSGNIRHKLAAAQHAAEANPDLYASNVTSLVAALPAPLEPADISVRLGATWVPPEMITQFIYELLDTPSFYRDPKSWSYIAVYYNPIADSWTVRNKDKGDQFNQKATTSYGTSRANAYRLLEDCLNQKSTKIYDTVTVGDKEKRVVNTQDTLAAQDKQDSLQKAFQDWVWKDVDRAERLATIYNERFNSYRPPVYDGDMVVFHGINPYIQLRPHQKNAVARMLFGGNTLLDHDVGAGKTWTMVAAAMEGKHLGLCNKTIITVPNHLVGQWASSVYQLYPSANILAATKRDFETKNRKKFCSRIATGDYDIVILGHSQFGLIPISAERQQAGIKTQIEEITDAIVDLREEKGQDFSIKQLERLKKQLETKSAKLYDKKHDDVITFEQLGADRLFVDESHEFKNLFLFTKMSNVAGISQTDSQKASDLFLKCRYMDELTDYKGTAFATGTAISNTMAEMYTVQRYLQYNVLQEAGLTAFDAWAANFGEVVNSVELAPEGNGFRARTRFAKFHNLPELLSMYHLFADTQTRDMMNLPLPEVEVKTVVLPASEAQKEYIKSFGDRADRIRKGGVNPSEDNMLCITNDGRKLALDQRLIDPTLPDDPNSKVNATANLIYDSWLAGKDRKLTQVVFCDTSTPKKGQFNVYDDLKSKLIAKGIPEEEIRFVHDAKTDVQKEALFSQVRTGDVRILMGSTGKLGTGTNVQDLLSDLYDLDCPWRPSDLEQRRGRGDRQGNTNDTVRITRIVKEGTFDAYMYQLIETKQRFISQIRNGSFTGRSAADVDQATLSYAEIKALATGDPRIREKVELEIELSKLSVLSNRHKNNQLRLQRLIERTLPERIASKKACVANLQADLAIYQENASKNKADDRRLADAIVAGHTCKDLEESGTRLYAALQAVRAGESEPLGTLCGLPIFGHRPEEKGSAFFTIGSNEPITISPFDWGNKLSNEGLMRRMHNSLSTLPSRIEEAKQEIENQERLLETSKKEYGIPFDREEELITKEKRLKELSDQLNLDQPLSEEVPTLSSSEETLPPARPSFQELLQAASRQGHRDIHPVCPYPEDRFR